MFNPERLYIKRQAYYEKLLQKHKKTANQISNLRLLIFIIGFVLSIVIFYFKLYILGTATAFAALSSFIYLVIQHNKVLLNKKISSALVDINQNSEKRANGGWKDFNDTGAEYIDIDHEYSFDLDMFGKGSLFQLINVTKTYLGRIRLREMLTKPLKHVADIKSRQEAVRELAGKLIFRQRFEAEGSIMKDGMKNPDELIKWAENIDRFYLKKHVVLFFRILPFITNALLILTIISGKIHPIFPASLILIQFILMGPNIKKRSRVLNSVAIYNDSIKAFERLLLILEKENFESQNMIALKKQLTNADGKSAIAQIKKLSKLVDSISNRYNLYYFFFNLLTLWDYQCQIRLEQWKFNSGSYLKNWIDTIAETEALSSLAVLKHDNPEWAEPSIDGDMTVFMASGMGHPLLGNNKVCNDLNFNPPVNVILITGSNMSGKSTLLRTAGINLVLAYIGAPVCAESFRCSIMNIYTCMRVSDNLEKNISSFYAELIRIKSIVKAAGEGKVVFFLLDEIFKGTNSADRHAGATVLVKKLSQAKTLGMVSTHDLELGDLEVQSKKTKNYHFMEWYSKDEIKFDYKLKEGISTTKNAIYLMKMAGIEFK